MVFSVLLSVSGYVPAVADSPEDTPKASIALMPAYQVETDDVLEISVYGHDDLTKTVTVLPDGTISYPILGELHVAGLTLANIKRHVVLAMKDLLVDPFVTVAVVKRATKIASVLGPVSKPGEVEIKDGWHLLDLIAAAGGLTTRPEWVNAALVRGATGVSVPIDLIQLYLETSPQNNIPIIAGDKLVLTDKDPATLQVQVVGEVVKQGAVMLPDNGSIVAVLNAAGGPTPDAALTQASIVRGEQIIPVNLSGYTDSGKIVGDIRLQRGDTLVVPKNRRLFAVIGAVYRPGPQNYPETGNVDVIDAVTRAGGVMAGGGVEADMKNATIIHNASTSQDSKAGISATPQVKETNSITYERIDLSQLLKKGNSENNRILRPGDVLFIPSKRANSSLGWREALAVTPLLSAFLR